MMTEFSLNGVWALCDTVLGGGIKDLGVLNENGQEWIATPVPGDIHQGLLAAGRISEPLVGLNSAACAWTEDRAWWFRRVFDADPVWEGADVVELELNGLDSNAEVYLNSRHLGSHRNAFHPFIVDIKQSLRARGNILLVRLTSGLETVSKIESLVDGVHANLIEAPDRETRSDIRRLAVRKPQYVFGWDWCPRVASTAIGGDVLIRPVRSACIRDVAIQTEKVAENAADALITVAVDHVHTYRTRRGSISVTLTDADGNTTSCSSTELLRSGMNYVTLAMRVPDVRLWWPAGLGDQHLYHVEAKLSLDGEDVSSWTFDHGFRFAGLRTDGEFGLEINGERVFCKGANWIPADLIYARVDAEKTDSLVREARDANFNMLRVWGGGLYEREDFYRSCDRYGILVWQDFMFACSPYPDHEERFCQEVEREADHQTRRLRRHPCVVLWCGCNECNWGFEIWWHGQTKGGAFLYNYLLPEIVNRNCPETPYWNGSPYGGSLTANDTAVGDCHYWIEERITPEVFDACDSPFVSEFGVIGSCTEESTRTYLDGAEPDRDSEAWIHHMNMAEAGSVSRGIQKHYGIDPSDSSLALQDYLLYSGLFQGVMYQYALESMRYRANCHGSLFWMYNDCWGEVGWTIVDYYLRRKVSWYFVRRAFEPVRLILRETADGVSVVLANDTRESVTLELEYGYVSLDGESEDLARACVVGAPLARTELIVFDRAGHDLRRGLWIARDVSGTVEEPAVLRTVDYAELEVTDPALQIDVVRSEDRAVTAVVSAAGYAHAVQIVRPPDTWASDDFFDLLPGERREVSVTAERLLNPDEVGVRCVNAK